MARESASVTDRAYTPCRFGIHVCGIDEKRDEFYTHANYPHASRDQFLALRDALATDDKAARSFVVDLMVNGDIVEDFSMTRQMLDRLDRTLTGQK